MLGLGKLKNILGVIVDVLLVFRKRGWIQKKIDPIRKKPKRGF